MTKGKTSDILTEVRTYENRSSKKPESIIRVAQVFLGTQVEMKSNNLAVME
jgi:hypothetical protein